jgi:hypothetical protein
MENSRIGVILPNGKPFERIFNEVFATAELGSVIRIYNDLADPKLTATLNAIESCARIVADVTARNPHTMFLAGYARALKKPILYLTQHAEDFPFSDDPIIYGSDAAFLKRELIARISGINTQPAKDNATDARAKFLSIFGDLLQKHGQEHHGPIEQNEANVFTLIDQNLDLALVQDIARRGRELNIRVRLM